MDCSVDVRPVAGVRFPARMRLRAKSWLRDMLSSRSYPKHCLSDVKLPSGSVAWCDGRCTRYPQEVRGSSQVTDQNPEGKFEALAQYARDLTQAAREGKLDPVIGRDEQIRRAARVLLSNSDAY